VLALFGARYTQSAPLLRWLMLTTPFVIFNTWYLAYVRVGGRTRRGAGLQTTGALLLLASISGGIPLLIYFEGLRLTRASTAGYFEMMQTLAAVCITWGFFHATLHPHQIAAGIILMVAVAMVQNVQARAAGRVQ
jgi:drug/metabolite transporter (DMT)-like permease